MANVKLKVVELSNVFLDNNNPRHDPIDAEPEIIARLVAHERVANLAASIAANGTSPLERLAVIAHPSQKGKYTVVEGNRRLCALKLLRDPRRAPTPQSQRQFETLKAGGQPVPKTMEVAVFADRKAARYWLSLRHEGEQDGVGTRQWKSPEKTRFNSQESPVVNPNAQALALINYAEQRGILSAEEKAKVPLTTVTRYLSNPVVRSTFGLTNHRDLTIDVPQDAFDKGIGKFFADVSAGIAHSRTKSTERTTYVQGLAKAGHTPSERVDNPTVANPAAPKVRKTASRSSQHPDKRKYIVQSGFAVKSKDSALLRVFRELQTISPDDFPYASGYLLRAFVERVAHLYAKKNGVGINGKKLHEIIAACCDKLATQGATNAQLKPLRVMANKIDEPTSPDTLGASVHMTMVPTASGLKAKWEELSPGLRLMLDRLG